MVTYIHTLFQHNIRLKIMSIICAVIVFYLYQAVEKSMINLTVPIEVLFPENYAPSELYVQEANLKIYGEDSVLALLKAEDFIVIADIQSNAQIGHVRVRLSIERRGTAEYHPLEVTVIPSDISITLEQMARTEVAVIPQFHGIPEVGYELGQYSLTPSKVVLEGAQSLIQTQESISTYPIDLTGRQETFSIPIYLNIPALLQLESGRELVVVDADIKRSLAFRTFINIPITIENFPINEGWKMPIVKTEGRIRVQGSKQLLDGLNNSQFRLLANATNLNIEGNEANVVVIPEVPQGLLVIRHSPVFVIFMLEKEDAYEKNISKNKNE